MTASPAPARPGAGSSRLDRVREFLGDSRDRVVISASADLRWLCGFTGSNGWLIVGGDDLVLITDGRYTEQARLEAEPLGVPLDIVELVSGETFAGVVARVAHLELGKSPGRLLYQSRNMNVAQFHELQRVVDIELVPLPTEFDRIRRHKDSDEVRAISRAAEIADLALSQVRSMLAERPTECDVRDELEYRMRRLGADGPSYDTIVATGPVNSAKPHHRPNTTVVEEGHSVVIDVGALVEGYHSDMTRTYLIGEVDSELCRLYDLVREAQAAAVDMVRPGVSCREVDRACRAVFEAHGVENLFIHGAGHGVGLAIHEDPYIGRASGATLEVGDVVTVEPGLYRMGLGGVRIEDLLVVTQDAHHCLTSLPKDSPCLPSPPTT